MKSRSGGRRDLGRQVLTCMSCSERADAGILLPAYRLTLFSLSKGAAEGMKFFLPFLLATFTSYCIIAVCIIVCRCEGHDVFSVFSFGFAIMHRGRAFRVGGLHANV